MNAAPVIARELRSEARNPHTFSLRLAGAAILLALLAFFWLTTPFARGAGDWLFARLHTTLFLAIWLFVPIMACDCISRERRERTLGLLFLTPLRPLDIVVAKGLVHGLRAGAFWLAVLPVLAVPLLLGGVGWSTAMVSVLVNFSALCWALSAGLLASALSKTRTQAQAIALTLAAISFFVFGYLTGMGLYGKIAGGWSTYWVEKVLRGLWLDTQLMVDWAYFRRVPAGAGRGFSSPALLWITGKLAVLSGLVLMAALLVAGRIIRSAWQERPTSAWYVWFYRVFCTPFIWREFFDRWIRRRLEANPIGWLEQRQWTGRTAIGAWLAVIVSIYIVMLQDVGFYRRVTTEVQATVAWLLAVSMAAAATGSFRRERELGVMELLLVTPLGPRNLAWGRLRGIWEQFFPAIAMLLGVWIYVAAAFGHISTWPLMVFSVATFAAVPVIGLHFSLTQRSPVVALAWTLTWTFGPPALVSLGMIAWVRGDPLSRGSDGTAIVGWLLAAAVMIATAGGWWKRLLRVLRERSFPMEVK